MGDVSITELRSRPGVVVDRAASGETMLVTRSGEPVAQLQGLPQPRPNSDALVSHWKQLPSVDAAGLLADVEALFTPSLWATAAAYSAPTTSLG